MVNKLESSDVEKGHKPSNHVSVFENTLHKSELWVMAMRPELDWLSNDTLYHILRAVLHALRDNLSIDEAAHFSAQLPLLLRGSFYECWDPQRVQPKGLSKQEFMEAVRNNFKPVDRLNFDLEVAVSSALGVIMGHISSGEMDDIIQSSKSSLKSFFKIVESFNLGRTYQ